MTPRWHPSRALTTGYAAGTLPFSPSLAIAVHLEACPACRSTVRDVEESEGRRLTAQSGVPLNPDALDVALARLDAEPAAPTPTAGIFEAHAIVVPASLERLAFLPPVHLGPDVWVAHLDAAREDGWRTYVLCGPANMVLPEHGHVGNELIVVLEGEFHDHRRFQAGDFAENPPGLVHGLRVSPHGRAVALIAAAGPVSWRPEDRKLGELFDI